MGSTHATAMHTTGRQYLAAAAETLDARSTSKSPNQQLLPLTATVNQQDHLEIGGCDVVDLVQKFGSPLYILDEETLRLACRQYRDAFIRYYPGESQVLYASKAWNCLAVCAIVASEGLGIDIVSGGELYTALQAGVDPTKLYLHGNNKARAELLMAVEAGCTIVVDNWHELKTLVAIAAEQVRSEERGERSQESELTQNLPYTAPPTRIMLRLTPGIECHTHDYIRTGSIDSKFGFGLDQLDEVFQFISQQPSLMCIGLHAHIGSQIFELEPHHDLGAVMVQWLSKAMHHGLPIQELDIGGGLGIRYTESDDPPSIEAWVKVVSESIAAACKAQNLPLPKLLSEPGRSLIGSACVTAYTIGGQKTIPDIRTYVTVDGGMSDNPRPITYQSVYRAVVANRMSAPLTEAVAIAGKHCESGDIVIKEAALPTTQPNDLLVVMATGAYNYSMASNYNRIARPAAVLVQEGEASIILQRETYQDLLRQDRLPERLK
ncbi:diaminopimelate decarboxylase [Leptolyngbya sp. FACHB-321]|uniref:diaminopimelate decarboxylase n=1 Tax=Leptolyngbya sp. FACHB-321 TaxID=2692807 RepID=UPI001689969C|nr:diaminopimelate decarboxylase [Leptolyngbya sp. FACHB-321]MBD2038041.1 diaminopimelate decarboxylase [Leptolyngbya sp. FACHB-321]